MAEIQSFATPSGQEVQVEVESGGGGSPPLAEAMRVISAIGSAVIEELRTMPADSVPEEIELTLGLTAQQDGALAVSRGMTNSNFRLTLRWSGSAASEDGSEDGDLPGLP